jgi:hypothetical protein
MALIKAGFFLGLVVLAAGTAEAQGTPRDTTQPARLDTVVTRGRVDNLVGIAASANQGTVGAADLALRPLLRPGEIVENVPGVIVTQHSGSGKANPVLPARVQSRSWDRLGAQRRWRAGQHAEPCAWARLC